MASIYGGWLARPRCIDIQSVSLTAGGSVIESCLTSVKRHQALFLRVFERAESILNIFQVYKIIQSARSKCSVLLEASQNPSCTGLTIVTCPIWSPSVTKTCRSEPVSTSVSSCTLDMCMYVCPISKAVCTHMCKVCVTGTKINVFF